MRKSELITAVYQELGQTIEKRAVRKAVNAIFEDIAAGLERGDRVEIRRFGSFEVKHYPPRKSRNPRTGETFDLGPSCLPRFRPGKTIIAQINGRGSRRN
ncbi:HU family DNA-binding protein [Ruegeria atlantica]|uniref:HU family DNA-binding protein n=1 Tax=Ruegeria atlantica TaxID=81569 RepID=UPI00147EEE76|nr:HU family DNA-binding protein [Ruegeria atlantica]